MIAFFLIALGGIGDPMVTVVQRYLHFPASGLLGSETHPPSMQGLTLQVTPQHGSMLLQHALAAAVATEFGSQHGSGLLQHGSLDWQHGPWPVPQQGLSRLQHSSMLPQQGSFSLQHGSSLPQHGLPSPQQRLESPQQSLVLSQQGSVLPQQGLVLSQHESPQRPTIII